MTRNIFILLFVCFSVACSSTPPQQASTFLPGLPPSVLVERPLSEKAPSRSSPAKHSWLVLDHHYFVIYYDPSIRLARFVKYTVRAEDLKNTFVKRGNKFKTDPLLLERLPAALTDSSVSTSKEYAHSGYDQGHLAPSGDFAYNQKANDETFVMSNMAPQKPALNRQAWRLLEDQVRKWACGEEKITVLTGPILSEKPKTLKSGLPIPEQFFKIVIDETPPRKAIAFIYNQTDKENVLRKRVASVAEIEKKSNQNFADELPPEDRPLLRQSSRIEDWKSVDCLPKKKSRKKTT